MRRWRSQPASDGVRPYLRRGCLAASGGRDLLRNVNDADPREAFRHPPCSQRPGNGFVREGADHHVQVIGRFAGHLNKELVAAVGREEAANDQPARLGGGIRTLIVWHHI